MRLEDLGLVGNCQFSALIERSGSVVWCCLPRFDSDPIFGRLLDADNGGQFLVGSASGEPGTQRYVENTNVLETVFSDADGRLRVVDMAPRFEQHGRVFRPTMLVRIVEPIEGTPRARVLCDPRLGWTKARPVQLPGSNHVRFEGFQSPVRLTTDIPLSYLGGQTFTVTERRHLVLTWGATVEEPLAPMCDRYLDETVRYWRRFVKQSNVPPSFQKEVIRSALALKLHCFEDTGAIIAAMTTSIPEGPGTGRTWDYRYCWLRDAFYALGAFGLLGHFEERESFVSYLLNLAGGNPSLDLAPLYRVDGTSDLEERTMAEWRGFEGDGPVRVGNNAALHRQIDIFGEMVLALAPVFLDERFRDEQSVATLDLLERLARKAISVVGTPDASIWEYRTEWQPQTFSSLMCWAAADRMAAVASRHLPSHAEEFRDAATRIRDEIVRKAWSPELGFFAATYGGANLDASLLQMVMLRFLPSHDLRMRATVDAVARTLGRNGWLMRYLTDDGFGVPSVAFVICTFWLIEALAMTGRSDEAYETMQRVLEALSPLGLVSEDYDTSTGRSWGNFPQAYSHIGLIRAAFAASPDWSDVL
ncbi:MAG: glycoside hydrolase family 15 protein [Deltaproteobacteria bacterium]|nr:glycoside hydrolase family 15 protein [Deltaproteobacteria bacterium]